MNMSEYIHLWGKASVRVLDVRHIVMEAGESLSAYSMPAKCFIYVIRGNAQLKLDGQEHAAVPFYIIHSFKGMILNIPRLSEPFEYQIVFYKPFDMLSRSRERLGLLEKRNSYDIHYVLQPARPVFIKELFTDMHRSWISDDRLKGVIVQSLFLGLVYELLKQLEQEGTAVTVPDLTSQAIGYMDNHYMRPISVSSVADALDCSPRHLSRLFQKSGLGETPSDYLARLRLEKSGELLRDTSLTLQEIAVNVGYQDGYYFSRMFKKYTGVSPMEYRKEPFQMIQMKEKGPKMSFGRSEYSIAANKLRRYIDNNNHYYQDGGYTMNKSNVKKSTAIMLFISLSIFLAACGGASGTTVIHNSSHTAANGTEALASEGTARIIQHDLGETNVPESPERIVVLEQGFAQIVAALEVKPIGVADDNKPERFPKDTLEYIQGYTSVGTRSEPNLEVIRTLEPDLIIADTSRHSAIYEQLSEIAPTIVFKNDTADYAQSLAATEAIGEALGKGSETQVLIQEHQDGIEELRTQIDRNKTVLMITPDEEDGQSFQVRTSTSFHPSFLIEAGLQYALMDEDETNQLMTTEQLLAIDPDVMLILLNEDATSVIEAQADNPLWNSLAAVQNNNVHEVELATWSRQRSIVSLNQIMDEAADIF
ncbi:ABC transporter substrate-binding protein [Paenibacillus urinalis]|uniref:ABC transporter substrate-binding protein n=1 Tax=Paenibacillus urinalis TaxID=521520 RepID=A0ABY7X7H5_9BACL|nr:MULTISPECIES: ABC transporter substrate-binding protein [Paenibacillus]WDH97899.1 ABC transporter substrate-binding protein [Paenibacillus urinalis]WDI01576.1 ABC transporter substrate-binding protein [Paenibacillus urinalis]GAK43466.1 iron-siderophore ABC transporter permease protien [Paenibacillus sp. TCA20]